MKKVKDEEFGASGEGREGSEKSLREVLPAVTLLLGGVPLLTVLVLVVLN